MANNTITSWFDHLESIMDVEARLTGLLSHSSTIGTAREFLVKRVLGTILPSGVHVGIGKVIDWTGAESKQIDIIIYDPRFPFLKIDGGGLYPIEGVLATIEVKSTLDKTELIASLDNCKSVLTLHVAGQSKDEADKRIRKYSQDCKISYPEAEQLFFYMYRPATYVFSFTSKLSLQTTASCICEWWASHNCDFSNQFPILPRVISTGNSVGVVNDGRIRLNHSSGEDHVMCMFSTTKRFRWLAIHIMDSVNRRLGLRNFAEEFDYDLSAYFPFDEYIKELRGANTIQIKREKSPTMRLPTP